MQSHLLRVFSRSLLYVGLFTPVIGTAQLAYEREQLQLILTQLDNIEALARQSQKDTPVTGKERFYFDYTQFERDLKSVRLGINSYLNPGRAQPREITDVQANYQRDRGSLHVHD